MAGQPVNKAAEGRSRPLRSGSVTRDSSDTSTAGPRRPHLGVSAAARESTMKYLSESSRSRREPAHPDTVQGGPTGGYARARPRAAHLTNLAKASLLTLIVAASTASLSALRT